MQNSPQERGQAAPQEMFKLILSIAQNVFASEAFRGSSGNN